VRELSNEEDLQVAIPELLTACAYKGTSYAVNAYAESEYINQRLSPVYVTSVIDTAKISEVSVRQPLKTYYITEKDKRFDDVEKNLDITVIRVSDEGEGYV
jgi:hypothetical protein